MFFFTQSGTPYFEQIYTIVGKLDIRTMLSYVSFYNNQIWGNINSIAKLSEKQRNLYGLVSITE